MLFSSMIFIWVFLPIVIIVNFLLSIIPFRAEGMRIKAKNIFLLIASLCFYAWGGGYCLLIMLSSILVNYLGGLVIGNEERGRSRKLKLTAVIAINLGILVVFKYFNMLVAVVETFMDADGDVVYLLHHVLSMEGTGKLGFPQIVLPIGISFFTFQAMSYVIDVYMKKTAIQKNLYDFALYVSFFPSLLQGRLLSTAILTGSCRRGRKQFFCLSAGRSVSATGLERRFCLPIPLRRRQIVSGRWMYQVWDAVWHGWGLQPIPFRFILTFRGIQIWL